MFRLDAICSHATAFVIGAALGLLASASEPAHAATTFVYCSEGSPSTFNPQMATDGPTFNASARALYNRLIEFEPGGTRLLPGLAQSWDVSKDGKTITFKLRPAVPFHETSYFKPTRPFNADDVVFTFERMMKADHPFHKTNGGVYEYFKSMELDTLIKSVVKVDAMTVRFELASPQAPFLANLAMDFASILSAEYGDTLIKAKTLEKMDVEPIGTGPFVLQKYAKDSQIRYAAHPTYWAGKQAIDKLVFAITTDANVRYQKLKRGECQVAAEPPQADLKAMRADPKLKVLEGAGLNVGYMAMNVEKGPFKNKLVRQAINLALNRAAYVEAIYLGNAIPAVNPIPPSMWSYDVSAKSSSYDPERAKALLKQAGFPNGFETSLWWPPISRPYNPNGKKMAELIQADLAKIGIKARLETYDWSAYLDKARKGEHEMILMGWTGDNGDPDNFMGTLLGCGAVRGGSNVARWCHKPFESAVTKARETNDLAKRTKFYVDAQKIFREEAPWAPIAHAKAFRALQSGVTGFYLSPLGTDSFLGVAAP